MSYGQLTLDERYHIQVYRKAGRKQIEIARLLKRHPSTISRELRRNSIAAMAQPYLAERAQRRTHQRRIDKGERCRKIQGELQALVEAKLRLSWSPEQIAGRLRSECGVTLSHETIYQHVIRDAKKCGFLRYCLRFGGYKQFRMKKSHALERTRERKNWIDARPAAANDRTEVGHWERDCIVGERGGAVLLTMIDRRTRYSRFSFVARHTAKLVAKATRALLAPFLDETKTITNDNGAEFQKDEKLQRQLGVPIYFTDPSSPWQRGSIENLNGLVRQYIRKGAKLDQLPSCIATALEETLNNRPRKILGYRTPREAFFDEEMILMNQKMRLGLEFGLDF